MDSLLTAAARALSMGDPLGALKRVALRDDAPSLALRGIAMAQLGEVDRADELLGRAAGAFGPREAVARARCAVARAELALARRELASAGASDGGLDAALRVLEARGDRANAAHGRLVSVRRLLLLGEVAAAEEALSRLDLDGAPAMLIAIYELVAAELALRTIRTGAARAAFGRARLAADRAGIPALAAEIDAAVAALEAPAARLVGGGVERAIRLDEVEAVLASDRLVIDACRRAVRASDRVVALAKRPVLFSLARTLAESWPGDAPRDELIVRTFGARRPNESHRARLRVEMGRLRRALRGLAEVRATVRGFVLAPARDREVTVLAPPIDDEDASLIALLADGQAWSTSGLALAVGASQRTVQRRLAVLESGDKVRSIGNARARRWLAPPAVGFTTTLLLPAAIPFGR